jgi:hypothetical protein
VKAGAFQFMIQSELIELMDDFLSYDLDNVKRRDGHTPTDLEKVAQLNYGVRSVSRFIRQYDPRVVFTMTASTSEYDLRDTDIFASKMIEVKQVIIDGSILRRPDGSKGLYKYQEAERYQSGWDSFSAATPSFAFQLGDKLHVLPPPTSAIAAETNYVSGVYLAADMVYGADVAPDIPEELHEAVAYCGAIFASLPTVGETTAMNRVMAYRAEWQEAAKEIRRRNMKYANDFGVTPGSAHADYTYLG